MSAPETQVGCKDGWQSAQRKSGFSLRLCGEFPFGCGYAALSIVGAAKKGDDKIEKLCAH